MKSEKKLEILQNIIIFFSKGKQFKILSKSYVNATYPSISKRSWDNGVKF